MCGITGWVSFHPDARPQAPGTESVTAPRHTSAACRAVPLRVLPGRRPSFL
ncbi:hypothetical protein ABZ923_11160 [Streptomyces sp. NPDC046881]|uniref:hypothetical protein n=1 Tax=Streptomyces sp. NPDC046881 TaxID=3155374 RepID=UPI0033CF62D2